MFNNLRDALNTLLCRPREGPPPADLTEAETSSLSAGVNLAITIHNDLTEHGPALQNMARTLLGEEAQFEPLFGDGCWCQNCSKVRVEKAGDFCTDCRILVGRTFAGLPKCWNCLEERVSVGKDGLCLACTGLKQLTFPNGVPVAHECYRCHRFGRGDAEFLSPHTGMCARCTTKERYEVYNSVGGSPHGPAGSDLPRPTGPA